MVVVDGGCCRGLFVLVCAGYVLMDMTSWLTSWYQVQAIGAWFLLATTTTTSFYMVTVQATWQQLKLPLPPIVLVLFVLFQGMPTAQSPLSHFCSSLFTVLLIVLQNTTDSNVQCLH
jgi:hypothetical protein